MEPFKLSSWVMTKHINSSAAGVEYESMSSRIAMLSDWSGSSPGA